MKYSEQISNRSFNLTSVSDAFPKTITQSQKLGKQRERFQKETDS